MVEGQGVAKVKGLDLAVAWHQENAPYCYRRIFQSFHYTNAQHYSQAFSGMDYPENDVFSDILFQTVDH